MPLHVLPTAQMPQIKDISDHCLESMHIFMLTVYTFCIQIIYPTYGFQYLQFFLNLFFFSLMEKCEIWLVHIIWLTDIARTKDKSLFLILRGKIDSEFFSDYSLCTQTILNIPKNLTTGFVSDFQYLNTLCISPMKSLSIIKKTK